MDKLVIDAPPTFGGIVEGCTRRLNRRCGPTGAVTCGRIGAFLHRAP